MEDFQKDSDVEDVQEKYTLKNILTVENVAEILSDDDRSRLGASCYATYISDHSAFAKREEKIKKHYNLALQISERQNLPFIGASDIVFPLLTKAVINFAGVAYPTIVKDDIIVKIKILGGDEGEDEIPNPIDGQPIVDDGGKPILRGRGVKAARGERVEQAMNNQLLCKIHNWENDTDRMMHILPVVGTVFRKIFYDFNDQEIKSELVLPQFLIVDQDANSLEEANRITQLIQLYPYQINEMIRSGLFIDFNYGQSKEALNESYGNYDDHNIDTYQNQKDKPHLFIEQHCRLDLDNDGYSEPYIVWVHKDSQTLCRIIPRFKAEDIIMNGKEVRRIKPEHYFVKYSFIPNPESPIYDLGYGDLFEHLNFSINASINQLMDAGHRNVLGGGFIGKNLRLKGGATLFKGGEWKIVDASGQDINSSLVPLPMPEPSPVMFQMQQYLIDQAEQLSLVYKMALSEIPTNMPATTMLAMMEQSSAQYKAAIDRIQRSLKKEFERIFALNYKYLSDEEYRLLCYSKDAMVKVDFDPTSYAIVPISNIDSLNNTQKLMKAQILDGYRDDPLMNGIEIRKYVLDAIGIAELNKFIVEPQLPPPPQPTPIDAAQIIVLQEQAKNLAMQTAKLVKEAEIKLQMDVEKARADNMVKHTQAISNIADADAKTSGVQIDQYIAQADLLERAVDRYGTNQTNQEIQQMPQNIPVVENSTAQTTIE